MENRLANAKSKTAVDCFADTLAKVQAETLGNVLGELEPKALLVALADVLAVLEASTLG